jgi:hypothetical protein
LGFIWCYLSNYKLTETRCLTCAKPCAKDFVSFISRNSLSDPVKSVYLLFYRWCKWGSVRILTQGHTGNQQWGWRSAAGSPCSTVTMPFWSNAFQVSRETAMGQYEVAPESLVFIPVWFICQFFHSCIQQGLIETLPSTLLGLWNMKARTTQSLAPSSCTCEFNSLVFVLYLWISLFHYSCAILSMWDQKKVSVDHSWQ